MDRAAPAAAGETEAVRTESLGTPRIWRCRTVRRRIPVWSSSMRPPGSTTISATSAAGSPQKVTRRWEWTCSRAATARRAWPGCSSAGWPEPSTTTAFPPLKAALGRVAGHPEVDANRIGAIGFCLGGSIVLTWACTDGRLGAIAPFYGAAPRPREAIRRLCPVVGSWPGKDFTTRAAGVLEAGLTAAGIPHDLKVYPGARHSFFNDQWRNYHAAAAADSWQRVLAFFAEHIRGSPAAAD